MRRTICASLFALSTALVGTEAWALGGGPGWGIHSGDTVHASDLLLYGEIGYPDLSGGLRYGMSEKFDIGGRLSLLWGNNFGGPFGAGFENIGLGGQFNMRFGLKKDPKFSVLLHLDPGFKLFRYDYGYYNCGRFGCSYSGSGRALFGLQVPFGAEFGIHFNPKWTLQFGGDLNLDIFFSRYVTLATLSPMVGAGFEFHVTDKLGLGVNSRIGAPIYFNSGCGYYGCGFNTTGVFQFFIGGKI